MPRKLKTYQNSQGFFDLAIAVPSMKASLEAWGSTTNLFHKRLRGKGLRKEEAAEVKKGERRHVTELRHKLGALRSRGARLAMPSANRNIRHRSGVPPFEDRHIATGG
jgi:hypothetical protein